MAPRNGDSGAARIGQAGVRPRAYARLAHAFAFTLRCPLTRTAHALLRAARGNEENGMVVSKYQKKVSAKWRWTLLNIDASK